MGCDIHLMLEYRIKPECIPSDINDFGFEKLKEGRNRLEKGEITEEEMNGVKTRLRVARRSARQRASVRAAAAAKNVLYGLPANFDEAFEAKIEALTSVDIADFVAECLRPEHAFALTVA